MRLPCGTVVEGVGSWKVSCINKEAGTGVSEVPRHCNLCLIQGASTHASALDCHP